jgi:hypothetical protein
MYMACGKQAPKIILSYQFNNNFPFKYKDIGTAQYYGNVIIWRKKGNDQQSYCTIKLGFKRSGLLYTNGCKVFAFRTCRPA